MVDGKSMAATRVKPSEKPMRQTLSWKKCVPLSPYEDWLSCGWILG